MVNDEEQAQLLLETIIEGSGLENTMEHLHDLDIPEAGLRPYILKLFQCEDLIGYEGELKGFSPEIMASRDYDHVCRSIRTTLMERVETQLESGGSTLFFDHERMSATTAHELIPLLLKRREQEVQEVTAHQLKSGDFCLNELWRTSYGFVLLFSQNYTLFESLERIEALSDALQKIGCSLSQVPTTVDDSLTVKYRTWIRKALREIPKLSFAAQDVLPIFFHDKEQGKGFIDELIRAGLIAFELGRFVTKLSRNLLGYLSHTNETSEIGPFLGSSPYQMRKGLPHVQRIPVEETVALDTLLKNTWNQHLPWSNWGLLR